MQLHRLTAIVAASCLAAACGDNLTESAAQSLTVDFGITPDHIHTYETEATFTVLVTSQNGRVVSDFDTLAVEVRPVSTDQWKRLLLAAQTGSAFKVSHVFTTSGPHDVRIVGRRSGQGSTVVLHQLSQPLHLARWHTNVGDYRVEFEGSPGDLAVGTPATVQFWVMQVAQDAAGNRPPVTGLSATIRCLEANGTEEIHNAGESAGGMYQASHIFGAAGGATATLRFPGSNGAAAEATVHLSVAPNP